ncbi:hypothetical protein JOQ06_000276 [Pogonophryne albipinna]|uniref:Uncharacterized protein n=1 Tax=Pogonophryne albipinna TaxID=1090488 RepID=A0AAD6AEZ7_9TELE|nr:hypothetical protein JOQ06_000276 [Pogonophryne albipinna]
MLAQCKWLEVQRSRSCVSSPAADSVQKEPPGVGDFTLLPSSTGSHCSLLNRHRLGLTPAVPPAPRASAQTLHRRLPPRTGQNKRGMEGGENKDIPDSRHG